MNRRPWLLIFLAILYCISPFIYPVVVSFYFDTPLREVFRQTLELNSDLQNIETFVIPVVLGLSTFTAHRWTYFVVVIGSLYLLVRNFYSFASSSDSVPVSGLILMNILFIFVVVYLSRRSTRAIYFNPKMRWWETDLRYVLGLDGGLARVGVLPVKIRIRDIAIGGAAIETTETEFASHETVHLEFQFEGKPYKIASEVVWERKPTATGKLIGVQWIDDRTNTETKQIRKLIQMLKARKTPTTRPPNRWKDFRNWIVRPGL